MGIATEAAVIGTNYSYGHRIPVEGLEMKTVFAVHILSIMSAIVGIFASTELHEMAIATGGSNDARSSDHSGRDTSTTQSEDSAVG